jgi:7-keto-8-aminopelargonate synthetase-like enzyme
MVISLQLLDVLSFVCQAASSCSAPAGAQQQGGAEEKWQLPEYKRAELPAILQSLALPAVALVAAVVQAYRRLKNHQVRRQQLSCRHPAASTHACAKSSFPAGMPDAATHVLAGSSRSTGMQAAAVL